MNCKKTKIKIIFFLILFFGIFGLAKSSFADSHYLSPTGTNSGTCTSQGSPCATLQYAFTKMSGGDTLYLADGTYTGSGNLIDQNNLPPSGSAGNYTTIRATNIPCQDSVACNQTLKVAFDSGAGLSMDGWATSSYVKIQGIFFKGSAGLFGTQHWYLKQCAVQGNADGNNATITVMSAPYTLLEDVLAFGKGRYKFLFYDYDRAGTPLYNVCRRCISRNDWSNDANNPAAGQTVYLAHDIAFLNSIDIDGDTPSKWWTNSEAMWGSFTQVVDSSSDVNWTVEGSIAINNANAVGSSKSDSAAESFTDVAGIKVGGGIRSDGAIIANRITLANVGDNQFTYPGGITYDATYGQGTDSQASFGFLRSAYSNNYSEGSLNNSIIRNVQGAGIIRGTLNGGDYINSYSIGSNDFSPTHHITTDPYTHGLLYPVRVESGSSLETAGSGGDQIGANITQILGADGTEYGASMATHQGSLWPWPYEDWVKAQMASMDTTIDGDAMPSPTRGFCASGNDTYGQPITLTRYIWQSLGNQIPDDIYGTSSDEIAPAAPTGLAVS
jgi:hypothetical protein